MPIRRNLCFVLGATILALAAPVVAQDVQISPMISGLEAPWALAHMPDGSVLITEKDGRLLNWSNGALREVLGVPDVDDDGQGGLMDITLPRDFAQSREVLLSYSKPQGTGNGTALARARLSEDGLTLEGLKDLFVMLPGASGGRHFGSRVVEARDGTLFLTTGDRGTRDAAQDRRNHNGTIIRINRDGSIPGDNPFIGQARIQPEIWSYGHRNPQGAGLDGDGTLWTAEHGAKGGDEVNLIRKGANYGWPVVSYGVHYSGDKIGEGSAKDGMEEPAHYWDPSIAPSGLLVYTGDMFADWQGDIFVGSLKFDYISRLEVSGAAASEVQQIKSDETNRVRDIVMAPDGSIWFISVGNGTIYKMTLE